MGKDPHFLKKYSSLGAYQQSKLAQVIYSKELGKRLAGTGVVTHSLEPGIVNTPLSEGIEDPSMKANLQKGITVEEGAKTHVHLATHPDVHKHNGEHWEKSKIISKGLSKMKYILAAHDLRASVGTKLWTFTEDMLAPKLASIVAE